MGIFSRTRDIIAANFSELLDQADDPAKMIRMIILEMEETLVEVRASAARTIADQKEMHRHSVKLDKLQADWRLGSPVTGILQEGGAYRISTADGEDVVDRVVLAAPAPAAPSPFAATKLAVPLAAVTEDHLRTALTSGGPPSAMELRSLTMGTKSASPGI